METLTSFWGIVIIALSVVISIFFLIWPLIIWYHLREQTKLLRKISEKV